MFLKTGKLCSTFRAFLQLAFIIVFIGHKMLKR